jgi:cytochrome aa3-600 menaquinol oxidase subunit 2
MDFEVLSQSQNDFNKWVNDVKTTANQMTKADYNKLLQPGVVGTDTFNGTHLKWVNTPKQKSLLGGDSKYKNGSNEDKDMEGMDMSNMDHSKHH